MATKYVVTPDGGQSVELAPQEMAQRSAEEARNRAKDNARQAARDLARLREAAVHALLEDLLSAQGPNAPQAIKDYLAAR